MLENNTKEIIMIGASTAIYAGVCGSVETDIKRIIAYSTCSQIGYMFVAAGTTEKTTIYHLWNHGYMKALLFICAGAWIHKKRKEEQDIRKIGEGINRRRPMINSMLGISTWTLIGLPYMSCYYSKDMIISESEENDNIVIYIMTTIGVGLTANYSIRLWYKSQMK